MTFITPKTFAVGEVLSAVDMNVFVRDNTADLDSRISSITDSPFSLRFVGRILVTESTTIAFDDMFGDGTDTSFVRALRLIGIGGGGGGAAGGTGNKVGGGGGAGGRVELFTRSLSDFQPTFAVTIGPGGAGGAVDQSGSNGGNTTAPGVFAAGGGSGSISTTSSSADMRTARGGTGGGQSTPTNSSSTGYVIRTEGDNGLPGFSIITDTDSSGIQASGQGASSPFGRGGRGQTNKGGPVFGGTGAGFGSGGGGGVLTGVGGDGAPGVLIIDMFQ